MNKRLLSVGLKGVAMGAADVVPGVSGGTIAFISGIYTELIESIKSIDTAALKLLFRGRFSEFWKKINGPFLLSLVAGIALSIFSLAKLMNYVLSAYPTFTWSFFFGLILASTFLVSKEIAKWNLTTVIALILGAVAAFLLTTVTPASTPETWWFIILSGALAICAMILPGISGAFILLLLGKYQFIMAAVADLRIGIILLFVLGAIIGITSFSRLLSWLFKNYNNITIAVLTGFMFGSLNKVWPWKRTVETYFDSHGVEHPLVERNILPAIGGDGGSRFWTALLFCVLGFALIQVIEYIAGRKKAKDEA